VWKAISRSVIGTYHQQTGLPCQDYGNYTSLTHNQEIIVGAVADGAGSAKYANIGAKLAVEKVLNCFREINNNSPQKKFTNQPLKKGEIEQVFKILCQEVIKALQDQAEQKGYQFQDLACTLLVFIATPEWLGAMQIGDGFMVVRLKDDDQYQLLFEPDKGEFANETTFITSSNALEEMQVKVLFGRQAFICAATDGLERVAIRLSDWTAFAPFFKPLEQYLEETENPETEAQYLMDFLKSERLNAKTTDDKTLLLCLF
jgi:serine/threonine protein phosphatase PrpC